MEVVDPIMTSENLLTGNQMATPQLEGFQDDNAMAMENVFETDLNHKANTIIYWYKAQKKRLDKIRKLRNGPMTLNLIPVT